MTVTGLLAGKTVLSGRVLDSLYFEFQFVLLSSCGALTMLHTVDLRLRLDEYKIAICVKMYRVLTLCHALCQVSSH